MRRPLLAAGLAGALLLTAAGVAGATADATANRLAGGDRYQTSAAVAMATPTFANRTVAIIASGDAPADAIAASYLSGASVAPLLLVERTRVPASVMTALADLNIEGVILVGGGDVLTTGVVTQLEDAGYGVERINGPNRYETARLLAELLPKEAVGTFGAGKAAFVVRADNFADALAAGPLSASQGLPILLTTSGVLHPSARAALTSLEIKQVVLLGGTTVISQAVQDDLVAMGIAVRREFGATRQETAVKLARIAVGELQFPLTRVLLARGDAPDFADALAGASRGGQVAAPLLLTTGVQTVGSVTRDYLAANSATIATVDILGGTGAISAGAEAAAVASARGQS